MMMMVMMVIMSRKKGVVLNWCKIRNRNRRKRQSWNFKNPGNLWNHSWSLKSFDSVGLWEPFFCDVDRTPMSVCSCFYRFVGGQIWTLSSMSRLLFKTNRASEPFPFTVKENVCAVRKVVFSELTRVFSLLSRPVFKVLIGRHFDRLSDHNGE